MQVQINLQVSFTAKKYLKKLWWFFTHFFIFDLRILMQKRIPKDIQIVLVTMFFTLIKHLILARVLFRIHFTLHRDSYKRHNVFHEKANYFNAHQWMGPSVESKGFGLMGNTKITWVEWLKFPVVISLFYWFWPFLVPSDQMSCVSKYLKNVGPKPLNEKSWFTGYTCKILWSLFEDCSSVYGSKLCGPARVGL